MAPIRRQKTNNPHKVSAERRPCPYCGTSIGVNGYGKHFAACKRKADNKAIEESFEEELLQMRVARRNQGESRIVGLISITELQPWVFRYAPSNGGPRSQSPGQPDK